MKFWVRAVVNSKDQEQLFVTASNRDELVRELETLLGLTIAKLSIKDFTSQVVEKLNAGEDIIPVYIKTKQLGPPKGSISSTSFGNIMCSENNLDRDGRITRQPSFGSITHLEDNSEAAAHSNFAGPRPSSAGASSSMPQRAASLSSTFPGPATMEDSVTLANNTMGISFSDKSQLLDIPAVEKVCLTHDELSALVHPRFGRKYLSVAKGCFVRVRDLSSGYSVYQLSGIHPKRKVIHLDTVYATDEWPMDSISNAPPVKLEVDAWVKKILKSTRSFPSRGFIEAKHSDVQSALRVAMETEDSTDHDNHNALDDDFGPPTVEPSPTPARGRVEDEEEEEVSIAISNSSAARRRHHSTSATHPPASSNRSSWTAAASTGFSPPSHNTPTRDRLVRSPPLPPPPAPATDTSLHSEGTDVPPPGDAPPANRPPIPARVRRPTLMQHPILSSTVPCGRWVIKTNDRLRGVTAQAVSRELVSTVSPPSPTHSTSSGSSTSNDMAQIDAEANESPVIALFATRHANSRAKKALASDFCGCLLFIDQPDDAAGHRPSNVGEGRASSRARVVIDTDVTVKGYQVSGFPQKWKNSYIVLARNARDQRTRSHHHARADGGGSTAPQGAPFTVLSGSDLMHLREALVVTTLPIPSWAFAVSGDDHTVTEEELVLEPKLVVHEGSLHVFYLVRQVARGGENPCLLADGAEELSVGRQMPIDFLLSDCSNLQDMSQPDDSFLLDRVGDDGVVVASHPRGHGSSINSGDEAALPASSVSLQRYGLFHAILWPGTSSTMGSRHTNKAGGEVGRELSEPGCWRLVDSETPLLTCSGTVPIFDVVSMATKVASSLRMNASLSTEMSMSGAGGRNCERKLRGSELNILWWAPTTPPHRDYSAGLMESPSLIARQPKRSSSLMREPSLSNRALIPYERYVNDDCLCRPANWRHEVYYAAVEVDAEKLKDGAESISLFLHHDCIFLSVTQRQSSSKTVVTTIPITEEP